MYYSSNDMQKAEIYCMKILDFNLSRSTVKQFYDIMTSIGFLFEDELKQIEYPNQFYNEGVNILDEILPHQDFIKFSSFDIAFSIVRYLREINFLEKSSDRKLKILEKIFDISTESYIFAWNFLCKIKNHSSINFFKKEIKENKISKEINKEIRSSKIIIDFNHFDINNTINKIKNSHLSPSKEINENLISKNFSAVNKPILIENIDDPNLIRFKENLILNKSAMKENIVNTIRSASMKKKNNFDENLYNTNIDNNKNTNIDTSIKKKIIKIFDYNDNDDNKYNKKLNNLNKSKNKDNYYKNKTINHNSNSNINLNKINHQFISNTSKKLIEINNLIRTTSIFNSNISLKNENRNEIFSKEKEKEFSLGVNIYKYENKNKNFKEKAIVINPNKIFDSININPLKYKIAAPIRRASKIIEEKNNLNLIMTKGSLDNKKFVGKRFSVDNLMTVRDFNSHSNYKL
jgi:hypothetical protein